MAVMKREKPLENAKVLVTAPGYFKRLSIDGLSKLERDRAWNTTITVDGKTLNCRSFEVKDQGGQKVLMLAVQPGFYEIVQK